MDGEPHNPLRLPNPAGVRLLAAFAWVWLIVGFPFLTDAVTDFEVGLALAASWLFMAVVWVIIPFASPGGLWSRQWRQWWLAAGTAGVVGLGLGLTDVGL